MIEGRNTLQRAVRLVFAAFLACALGVGPARAEESAKEWQPPPPMPDNYDWVQLISGEWLKGEIIAMYEETLEFESDKLNLQSLKWKDVKELRSARVMEIGFDDGGVLTGKIFIDEQTIRFVGEEGRQRARSEILSITAGAPREIDNWAIKGSLGVNARRGNSEQIEATTRAVFIRRDARNRINLEYLASFNRIDGITTTDYQRVTTGWNRYVSRRVFWTPFFGEWFRDPFQNIKGRWSAGAGFGHELVDTSKIDWKVEAGLVYQQTHFDSVGEGDETSASTPGFVASTTYEHEIAGWLDFTFDWRFTFVNEDSGKYTHHLLTGLELEITRILDLDITLVWDRTENPQEDAEGVVPQKDDYRLITSFGFEF